MSDKEPKIQGYTKDKLYELLPAVYRQRDIKLGKPLEGLVDIIARVPLRRRYPIVFATYARCETGFEDLADALLADSDLAPTRSAMYAVTHSSQVSTNQLS